METFLGHTAPLEDIKFFSVKFLHQIRPSIIVREGTLLFVANQLELNPTALFILSCVEYDGVTTEIEWTTSVGNLRVFWQRKSIIPYRWILSQENIIKDVSKALTCGVLSKWEGIVKLDDEVNFVYCTTGLASCQGQVILLEQSVHSVNFYSALLSKRDRHIRKISLYKLWHIRPIIVHSVDWVTKRRHQKFKTIPIDSPILERARIHI